MRVSETQSESANEIATQVRLLGHSGYGGTELRIFDPRPMVAYADNENDVVRLVREIEGQTPGTYVGVQPRPPHLFDKAPNRWKPATSRRETNCACDRDIEYITACFFDIDVISDERMQGYPASKQELARTLQAAQMLSRQDDLAGGATICCSGNGHYVLAPIVPISVAGDPEALRFGSFCRQLAERVSALVQGVRVDPVYNLSRVMRVMGTINRKAQPLPGRPHRTACFVTELIPNRSMALHHRILSAELPGRPMVTSLLSETIKCDLAKIEHCEFIAWCRQKPAEVTEPLWFALLTNLARLEGGSILAHEISHLDPYRYDHQTTEALIQRIIRRGYGPTSCSALKTLGFHCRRLGQCHARAPMYLTDLFSIWKERLHLF